MNQLMWDVERVRTDLMDAKAVLRADVERARTECMEDMAVLQEDVERVRADIAALDRRVRAGFEAARLQHTRVRQLLIALVNRIYQ